MAEAFSSEQDVPRKRAWSGLRLIGAKSPVGFSKGSGNRKTSEAPNGQEQVKKISLRFFQNKLQ